MGEAYNRSVALRWLKAFNQKKIGDLMALYAENAIHSSPRLRDRLPHTQGLVKGKQALEEYFQLALQLPGLRYVPDTILTDREHVLMEYVRIMPGEPKRSVVEALDIPNTLIQESRVFIG